MKKGLEPGIKSLVKIFFLLEPWLQTPETSHVGLAAEEANNAAGFWLTLMKEGKRLSSTLSPLFSYKPKGVVTKQ